MNEREKERNSHTDEHDSQQQEESEVFKFPPSGKEVSILREKLRQIGEETF